MAWANLDSFSGNDDYDDKDVLKQLTTVPPNTPKEIIDSIKVIAKRTVQNPEFSCKLNLGSDITLSNYTNKWTEKFVNGYENRPSKRVSNPIGTEHDSILDTILIERIDDLDKDIEKVAFGHRLAMSAENIVGHLLEEYISENLREFNWHCCWGETMKSIDFCHSEGALLQVKNSDNSENSSSSKVRDGTPIQHWFRRYSKTGDTNWERLNIQAGIEDDEKKLSESKFKEFVKKTINDNPSAIFVEDDNPWEN